MADLSSSNIVNLELLSQMLNPSRDDSSDDDMPDTTTSAYNPGNIGPKKTSKEAPQESVYAKKDSKAIWDEEEVPSSAMFEEEDDGRPQPEYDISYKQKVTSEDMFLGTSGKNPSSACCESLAVKITLPDTKMSEVELQVKESVLDCRSPKFKLTLPLPHPVDPDSGGAKWDLTKHVLEVTLSTNLGHELRPPGILPQFLDAVKVLAQEIVGMEQVYSFAHLRISGFALFHERAA